MESALKSFERRQRAVTQKHRKLAQGYVTKISRHGVIEHKPIRKLKTPRVGSLVPVLTVLMGMAAFKGLMLANLGAANYAEHVETLAKGSFADRLGAWVLGVDPVTLWIGIHLQAFLG
ncbi:hypothetical protein [Salipiger mangrovisoli]|uniref:Uncharacterized protein n=1 Tax=Salipiger mangrovisoli TaxID=2865933 RepID=A0ABR9X622_9RHOB|nr:hypothetical protein [Salipiger mangrovisoli]MBE9638913.1 hypothetical protein [Salipiger mangrovisoli]